MNKAQTLHMENTLAELVSKAKKKYSRGQKEHGGNMWQKPGMFTNLEAEVLDFIFYSSTVKYQIREAIELINRGDDLQARDILAQMLESPRD